jgi:ribosomal protein S18 acetylase RimI-like enzyme
MATNLVPKFKSAVKYGLFNAVIEIEHAFLQKLVDMGGLVIQDRDYFQIFAGESLAMLKVREDHVYIECLATPPDVRKQGHGKKAMQALCYAANHTNTILKLETAEVKTNDMAFAMPQTITIGAIKKNKIPVAKLKTFYEKFGFVVTGKGKKENNYFMQYTPKPVLIENQTEAVASN